MPNLLTLAFASAPLFAATAPQEPGPPLLTRPALHGDALVFCRGGDLWLTTIGGNAPARCLLATPWPETDPVFAPDGSAIAFTARLHGPRNVYALALAGGEPRRLTFGAVGDRCLGWSGDDRIWFETLTDNLFPDGAALQSVPATGGPRTASGIQNCGALSFRADRTLLWNRFVPGLDGWSGRLGGAVNRVCTWDPARSSYGELTDGSSPCHWPCAIGADVYFVGTDDRVTFDLWRLRGGQRERLTHSRAPGLRSLAGDGHRLAYECDGELFVFDPAGGAPQRVTPTFAVEPPPPPRHVVARDQLGEVALAPNGARIAVVARGDIAVQELATGAWRHIARTDDAHEHDVCWSPDGKLLAYASDAGGEVRVHIAALDGSAPRVSTTPIGDLALLRWAPTGDGLVYALDRRAIGWLGLDDLQPRELIATPSWIRSLAIAPDGRHIAFVLGRKNGLSGLQLLDRTTGACDQITDPGYDDVGCDFDPSGNWLFFASRRNLELPRGAFENGATPSGGVRLLAIALHPDVPPPQRAASFAPTSPLPLVRDGLRRRTWILPVPPGEWSALTADARQLWFRGADGWQHYRLGDAAASAMPALDAAPFVFDAARTRAFAAQGDTLLVQDLANAVASPARHPLADAAWDVDPRREWRAMYWAAWRHHRDHFHDAAMAGVDWRAVGDRYARYLDRITTRAELNTLIARAMAELPGSHNAIWDAGDLPSPPSEPAAAVLGATWSWDGTGVRLLRVLASRHDIDRFGRYESPLDDAGARVGEYLVAIDGTAIDAATDPDRLLLGKAGQPVRLELAATPTRSGARTVTVQPIANQGGLLYLDFVARSERYVAEHGNGRIGYAHVFDTNTQGPTDFFRAFFAASDRDAMLVDARWNRGGNTQPWIVATLLRRPYNLERQRHGMPTADQAAILGPKALLVNEVTASGGDLLAYEFRQRGAGPLIGARTAGRMIGVHWVAQLIDGGQIASSESHNVDFVTGNEIGEGVGVAPDLDVDQRPDLVATGRDPQLERAVAELLARLPK